MDWISLNTHRRRPCILRSMDKLDTYPQVLWVTEKLNLKEHLKDYGFKDEKLNLKEHLKDYGFKDGGKLLKKDLKRIGQIEPSNSAVYSQPLSI
uniref:Uncharacterized protein n=1 Tax=Rhodnius prolixus TaxID=13249 RepID=T1HK78_RHOPR